jgi:adenosylcobinamide-GDP ribazoletransferase
MYLLLFGFAYLFRVYITGKIGGITGDVMGAGSELAEVLLLLMVLVIIRFWGFPLGISSRIIELL